MSVVIAAAILMAPTAATTRSSAASGKVTLKVMHWNSLMGNQARWWTAVLHGFTAQHPNVTIET